MLINLEIKKHKYNIYKINIVWEKKHNKNILIIINNFQSNWFPKLNNK